MLTDEALKSSVRWSVLTWEEAEEQNAVDVHSEVDPEGDESLTCRRTAAVTSLLPLAVRPSVWSIRKLTAQFDGSFLFLSLYFLLLRCHQRRRSCPPFVFLILHFTDRSLSLAHFTTACRKHTNLTRSSPATRWEVKMTWVKYCLRQFSSTLTLGGTRL